MLLLSILASEISFRRQGKFYTLSADIFRGVSGIITKNERADKMSNDKKIVITTRDRVLRAWQNSTELVRDFENYAKETSDDKTAAEMFQKYAVDEGRHAAELLKLLHDYQDNGTV